MADQVFLPNLEVQKGGLNFPGQKKKIQKEVLYVGHTRKVFILCSRLQGQPCAREESFSFRRPILGQKRKLERDIKGGLWAREKESWNGNVGVFFLF